MLYKVYPCILKHRGSFKYFKYFISATRQKKTSAKPPVVASNKVFVASSNVSLPQQSFKKPKSQVENIIGKASQTALKVDEELQEHYKPVSKPDVTAFVSETSNKLEVDKNVRLLNTVNPAFLEWHKHHFSWRSLPKHYKSLSKFRLSGLVVITTLAGYGLAPGPLEPITLLCTIIGTGLTSAAANAVNQVLEVPYDSQMNRTKNRVLTRGFLTPLHASTFAACSAAFGLTTLYLGTNTLTAALGLTNLFLYTSVYTPMKRYSITNTWIGSVVGAIPPIMGWAACTGTIDSGALLLGALLYSWQFPHFNALSWNLKADYSRAGYRMTSVIDPNLCRSAALRHSVALLAFCSIAPLINLTTWTFAIDSLPLNCYFIYCAWNFYQKGDATNARKLFRTSLLYLPILMFLMFIGKKYTKEDKLKNTS